MKRNSAELKRISRGALNSRYGIPMGAMVVSSIILFVIMTPFSIILDIESNVAHMIIYFFVSFLISLASIIFQAGTLTIHLSIARKAQPRFSDLFYGFTRPVRFILAFLLLFVIAVGLFAPSLFLLVLAVIRGFSATISIAAIVCYILAIIAVVILSLTYALVFFLLVDHPAMGISEAFRESSRLMAGNKGRLFYIQLSFIGWSLLGVLSCSIGFLWIVPYIVQTTTSFYLDVSGELEQPFHIEDKPNPYSDAANIPNPYSDVADSPNSYSDVADSSNPYSDAPDSPSPYSDTTDNG
ncbi:DUF975 family protein [Lachnospiraceae bacterium ZAX-1]